MAENTKQARWITVLYGNLLAQYRADHQVFVAADNLWYPAEGHPEIRNAPDVYVVFGRPKGDRPSYKQWAENDVPLTIVFEILSPGNTDKEMDEKFHFYDEHGVGEYYVYDPDTNDLEVYIRGKATLARQHPAHNFRSPRMGIRFDLKSETEMVVYGPNDKRFLSFEEITDLVEQITKQADESRQQRDEARQQRDEAHQKADQATQRADVAEQQRDEARQNAADAQRKVDAAQQRADTLRQQLTRLRELSRKMRLGQASAEEIVELERLEAEQDSV